MIKYTKNLDIKINKIDNAFDNILKKYDILDNSKNKKVGGGKKDKFIDELCNEINKINLLEDIINEFYEFFNSTVKNTANKINNTSVLSKNYYNNINGERVFNDIKFAKIMMGELDNNKYPNNTIKEMFKKIIK